MISLKPPHDDQSREETRKIIESGFLLAQALGVTKVLIPADELDDLAPVQARAGAVEVVWLVRDRAIRKRLSDEDHTVVAIPETGLTRISQIEMGLFRATFDGTIGLVERVVCLSGPAGHGKLDTLIITSAHRNFPWARADDLEQVKTLPGRRVIGRLVDLALKLAKEGREGKPIGTTFVLAKEEEVRPRIKAGKIPNPVAGHPREARKIYLKNFEESLREYAQLDGGMVINLDGVVEHAGVYFDASKSQEGQGGRHGAARSITQDTEFLAVAISESSGDVTIFRKGHAILCLEQPGALPRRQNARTAESGTKSEEETAGEEVPLRGRGADPVLREPRVEPTPSEETVPSDEPGSA